MGAAPVAQSGVSIGPPSHRRVRASVADGSGRQCEATAATAEAGFSRHWRSVSAGASGRAPGGRMAARWAIAVMSGAGRCRWPIRGAIERQRRPDAPAVAGQRPGRQRR